MYSREFWVLNVKSNKVSFTSQLSRVGFDLLYFDVFVEFLMPQKTLFQKYLLGEVLRQLKKLEINNTELCHGTIIQTGRTCKKIPNYMCDSTCRWCINKKVMLNIFEFSQRVRNCRILIGLCK